MNIVSPEYARVRDCVAEMMGVVPGAMVSHGRRQEIADIRQIGYWVMHKSFPSLSFTQIGKVFGGRDHSTIIHGVNKVEDRRADDPDYREVVDAIFDKIDSPMSAVVLSEEVRQSIERAAQKYYPKDKADETPEERRHNTLGLDHDALKRSSGSRRLSQAIAEAQA